MNIKNFIISSTIIIFVMLTSSYFTKNVTKNYNRKWYDCIKSNLAPKSYVFSIVWPILYSLLGYIYYKNLENNNNKITTILTFNLLLNITWCYLFFYKKEINLAFANLIIINLTSIYIYFNDKPNKYYILPYIIWTLFALKLNYDSINKIC